MKFKIEIEGLEKLKESLNNLIPDIVREEATRLFEGQYGRKPTDEELKEMLKENS